MTYVSMCARTVLHGRQQQQKNSFICIYTSGHGSSVKVAGTMLSSTFVEASDNVQAVFSYQPLILRNNVAPEKAKGEAIITSLSGVLGQSGKSSQLSYIYIYIKIHIYI